MVEIKHPSNHCNIEQEEFLAKCPEDQKRFHELLFNHGNAVWRYHSESSQYTPTPEDFKEWLEGLPNNIRADMLKKGFNQCKTILSFTRYVNEKNDVGMEAYIKNLFGEDLYNEYREMFIDR
jgi:hypothetical protein